MGYKIVETAEAARSLANIVEYLCIALENKPAAGALLDEIVRCCHALADYPELYERCQTPHLRALGYRKAVIRHYIMIYKVDETQKSVNIMGYFHGKQDYEKML